MGPPELLLPTLKLFTAQEGNSKLLLEMSASLYKTLPTPGSLAFKGRKESPGHVPAPILPTSRSGQRKPISFSLKQLLLFSATNTQKREIGMQVIATTFQCFHHCLQLEPQKYFLHHCHIKYTYN